MLLPDISTEAQYRLIYEDNDVWLPAVQAVCERHAISTSALKRPTLGSNIVFQSEDEIIKLFPPFWANDGLRERATLPHLRGLPTPRILANGEFEGWPYVVMSTAEGTPALEVWSDIPHAQKQALMHDLGGLMRTLHDHPPVTELATDWNAFLHDRISESEQHHGAEEPWRSWIAERLDGFSDPPFTPVLLNADITEDHLLLSQVEGVWCITGFIDFADAMMGHPLYDFAAPFCFFTFGRPDLTHALIDGYGLEVTEPVAQGLITYCLLHQFGHLSDFLKTFPVSSPDAFYSALWGPSV